MLAESADTLAAPRRKQTVQRRHFETATPDTDHGGESHSLRGNHSGFMRSGNVSKIK